MLRERYKADNSTPSLTVIEPKKGWVSLDLTEIWKFRELLYFLTKRDIKVRYKQTVLGGLWAIIQPFFTMVVFTLFFGRLAKMPSDGVPYPIFVYAGLLPWTYFANAVTASGNSLVGSANLITKVYFPRLIIPASSSLAGLLDFFIAMLVLGGLMIHYQYVPGVGIVLFPFLVGLTFLRGSFHSKIGDPVKPAGEIPVPFAQDPHDGGNENHTDDGGVQEYCYSKSETQLLHDYEIPCGKSTEDSHHY